MDQAAEKLGGEVHPRTHGADTKFLKEIHAVDILSIPVTLDLRQVQYVLFL